MAKIVIIAPNEVEDDVKDAVKVLKAAGHEVEVEEPTPKSLLHMVFGLLGPGAYGWGPGYGWGPVPKDPDSNGDDDDKTDPPPADTGDDEFDEPIGDGAAGADDNFNFEGLSVDGEAIAGELSEAAHSVLIVPSLTRLNEGAKVTYQLNESQFAFWADAEAETPKTRISVEYNGQLRSVEVEVKQGGEGIEKPKLLVGQDLKALVAAS